MSELFSMDPEKMAENAQLAEEGAEILKEQEARRKENLREKARARLYENYVEGSLTDEQKEQLQRRQQQMYQNAGWYHLQGFLQEEANGDLLPYSDILIAETQRLHPASFKNPGELLEKAAKSTRKILERLQKKGAVVKNTFDVRGHYVDAHRKFQSRAKDPYNRQGQMRDKLVIEKET